MSYAMSAALQTAVYDRLVGDTTLSTLVGPNVFDAIPGGVVPALYVALGQETAKDASDGSGYGAWHDFTISVVSEGTGFAAAKDAAAAVSDALVDAALPLSRGRLVGLRFRKAVAARVGTGSTRRIDMLFRARVSDS